MSVYPYTYDDLLYRLHLEKSGEENYKKTNLPPIKVAKKNKTTIFINFGIFVEKLNRSADHIATYYKSETGIASSINAQGQLILQGILNETKTESILRNYIREYVICKQCKCFDTSLLKENGITYIICNQCQAKSSLGKI